MKPTVVALGLVGVLALASTAAFAWGPWHGRGFGAQGFGPGYGPGPAVANLSQDQIAKIQKIQSDRYAEMAKVRTEMFTKQTELRTLYREPTLHLGLERGEAEGDRGAPGPDAGEGACGANRSGRGPDA